MSLWYNMVTARIDLSCIEHNYRLLLRKGTELIPVVKADAYGHGLGPVAHRLEGLGAGHLAVGTVSEGAALRLTPYGGKITSLLGTQTVEDYDLVRSFDIIPVVYRMDQLQELAARALHGNRPQEVVLKFATGMNRLGFAPDALEAVIDLLRRTPGLRLQGVCSHLSSADVPADASVVSQGNRFQELCRALGEAGFTFQANLANSAALLACPGLHLDAQRPGIALYGANPFHGTPWEDKGGGLRPAMSVVAPVVSVHPLRKGEGISYGLTYVAEKDMTVAIVGVGYADNYSRGLSGRAKMLLNGNRVRVLGRVCMQLTAVDVSGVPKVAAGDPAFVLGGGSNGVTPEELAGWWGTISYEVFCLLGQNRREYLDGPQGVNRP